MKQIIDKLGVQDWPATIGWIIFIGLFIASVNDNYIINPFIFGFGYYVLYTLHNHVNKKNNIDLGEKLVIVCIIALIYLGSTLMNNIHSRSFVRHVEKTCLRAYYDENESNIRLCDEIKSHIDKYLISDSDDSYD